MRYALLDPRAVVLPVVHDLFPFFVPIRMPRRGGSHRGGLDADVGIYRTGGWQSQAGFTTLNVSNFDLEANWALISTFLDTGKIDMILLDQGHINRLKAYTLRTGLLDEEEITRIFPDPGSRESWASTGIVRHVSGHTDHLHVRVLCDDGTRGSR